ncbi:hypothetical protein B0H17DRAFT_1331463 [Mycena rosella]|uniref:Uncharacterized protein n=1 Tax=Mycena rosella TaxID=1033263 RepID=A0AAD7DG76_MYCRO|nr:hypothetical protein B0H17DRAFT_1331463 [Mycena rosella]
MVAKGAIRNLAARTWGLRPPCRTSGDYRAFAAVAPVRHQGSGFRTETPAAALPPTQIPYLQAPPLSSHPQLKSSGATAVSASNPDYAESPRAAPVRRTQTIARIALPFPPKPHAAGISPGRFVHAFPAKSRAARGWDSMLPAGASACLREVDSSRGGGFEERGVRRDLWDDLLACEYHRRWTEVGTMLPGLGEVCDEEWGNGNIWVVQNILGPLPSL